MTVRAFSVDGLLHLTHLGNSHDLLLKKWYISATLLTFHNALEVLEGRLEVVPDTYQGEKMKKNIFCSWTMMMAMLCIGFTSCGGDDDDDINSSTISTTERKLLGGWVVDKLEMVLQTDGKLCSGGIYAWQYNEDTGILSTNVPTIKNYSCQWQVTLISDDSWAGLELWHDTPSPVAAERLDIKKTACLLLKSRQWKSDTGIVIESFSQNSSGNYIRLIPYNNYNQIEIGDVHSIWFDKVSEDLEKDVIAIYDNTNANNRLFEIHHPYDGKKIYFLFPDNIKFYPLD